MVQFRLSLFLEIGEVFKILWHFEILTWESMGTPKMWKILQTTGRRAKRTKICDSGATVHICRVLLMPDPLGLVLV